MVNHYFGSKDDLYDTCAATMMAELAALRGHLAPLFLRSQDPRAAIDAAVRAAYAFAREHRDASRFALRGVLEAGELDPRRREELLVPYLDAGSALLAGYGGLDARQLRLPLQSLVFLVGRYAISSAAELAVATGTQDAAAAHVAVADHLVAFAQDALLPPAHPSLPRPLP
jgi:AcrR family transcriptional regulator